MVNAKTLYDKLWEAHVVHDCGDGRALLYIDRHLVQEVSSPLAFEGLEARGTGLRRPLAHLAVADHAVSTVRGRPNLKDSLAARQVERLTANAAATGMPYITDDAPHQGIVHVIGPELGFTLPGCTLVCGDSHTSTHGAFGALAFGIGTSQCETVFATQCLYQNKLANMRIRLDGVMSRGVTAKDVVLALIAKIGTAGAEGHAVEYCGPAVTAMSMEERMTLCNMTIEAGARIGLVAPDETTFAYLEGRQLTPKGQLWTQAVAAWRDLHSDDSAHFDRDIAFDVSEVEPQVSWGTNPAQTIGISGHVPDPSSAADPDEAREIAKSLDYIRLRAGTPITKVPIDKVFIGSCTNARIEDLRAAAEIARGQRVAKGVHAFVVPGSMQVAAQAEREGLADIFRTAGFEWRSAGCSMCVAMNDDRLRPGERAASTSNRNFEGRQGPGGLTHLMSPAMAAAAAIAGHITDVRQMAALEMEAI